MSIARQVLGVTGKPLYTPEALRAIQEKKDELAVRIEERSKEIERLAKLEESVVVEGTEA